MDIMLIAILVSILVIGLVIIVLLLGLRNNSLNNELFNKVNQLGIQLDSYVRTTNEEKSITRQEMDAHNKNLREEVGSGFQRVSSMLATQLSTLAEVQARQLSNVTTGMSDLMKSNLEQQEKIRFTLETNMKEIQASNEKKLDQMRQTVDEKLNATLATRLDNSFKQVGDQLQLLYKSLGEVQSLAGGVSDLNRVLTNVKNRGTWGEVQLGSILEQIMTPDQYAKNVATKKNSDARVEFAIKLPGKDEGNCVWLPIDAKFSQEDYLKIQDAADRVDPAGVEEATKALENRVKADARTIRDKYVTPPSTTDFAIMFLPTEGLYAEVLRRPGLAEFCQNNYRVMIAGPTTLAALLNSLRMGFATLAIEKKSSEVWKLLRAIKSQYGTFTELLDKSLKKINEAQVSMEKVKDRSEMINRKLGKVEELEIADAEEILGLGGGE
ncbi:MAG: hypothetical protein H6Q68_602 [Firmicutes bacterium]|nr:hypothetical protein [Bacillota bacterium]